MRRPGCQLAGSGCGAVNGVAGSAADRRANRITVNQARRTERKRGICVAIGLALVVGSQRQGGLNPEVNPVARRERIAVLVNVVTFSALGQTTPGSTCRIAGINAPGAAAGGNANRTGGINEVATSACSVGGGGNVRHECDRIGAGAGRRNDVVERQVAGLCSNVNRASGIDAGGVDGTDAERIRVGIAHAAGVGSQYGDIIAGVCQGVAAAGAEEFQTACGDRRALGDGAGARQGDIAACIDRAVQIDRGLRDRVQRGVTATCERERTIGVRR